MKKHLTQLLLVIPLLLVAVGVSAYTSPLVSPACTTTGKGSAPNCNTEAPIDTTSAAQIKDGGLAVGVFQAGNNGGSALLSKQTFFHGMLRGGTPADVSSTLNFGDATSKIDAIISGAVALAGNLQSDSLKASSGQQQVCADSNGKFFLCGGAATDTSNEKYIYSTKASYGPAFVDNLGNGDCTPGYTIFALDTGSPIVNTIGGFANPDLEAFDPYPNLLGATPDDTGKDYSGYIGTQTRPDADISLWNKTLALTAPQDGTYDIKYKNNGHFNMDLDNGKKAAFIDSAVSLLMTVKHANGSQDNYPMATVNPGCNYYGPANFYVTHNQPNDYQNSYDVFCGETTAASGTVSVKNYSADSDYAVDFSQSVHLVKGDRVYLYGLSGGSASLGIKGGGGFLGATTISGQDSCKPFKFTITSYLSIFDVTLH